MQFSYTIIDNNGVKQTGTIDAKDREGALENISQPGVIVASLEEVDNKTRHKMGDIGIGHVSSVEISLFTNHLSVMLKSGIPITEALEVSYDQAKGTLKKAIEDIREQVEKGSSLSGAIQRHPKVFSPVYQGIVQVGEVGGSLESSLLYLAEQLEKDHDTKSKVKSAMLYPMIVLIAVGVLGSIISYWVLPKLTELFLSFSGTLPLPTRILLFFAEFIEKYGLLIPVVIVALFFLIRFILRRKKIQPIWHGFLLSLPLFGKILKHYNLARFSRILATLLKSGVPISEALRIVAEAMTNKMYQKRINSVLEEVKKGATVADVLIKSEKVFPKIATRMIHVGEESGELEEVLEYLAQFYEKEVDNATKNLSVILEPVLLVFIGLGAAFVAISIIMPIYQLTGSVG